MTNTEKKIIKILNDYARESYDADEDILVPVEIDKDMCEIPTFPFEGIMANDEDEFSKNYNGPEIFTYIQMSEGKEIYSGAYCIGKFTDEQKKIIAEYVDRLEEIGEEIDMEDTEEGLHLEIGAVLDGESDDWEEQFVADLESEDADLEGIFYTLVYSPCYMMMDHAMTITMILDGETTIDEVVEALKAAMEEDEE